MKVGLVANPASGKDIRRIVAHGSVFDNQEKVRMVRRILTGLRETGVEEVVYMPEGYGIVPRALFDLPDSRRPPLVEALDMPLDGTQADTIRASALMEEMGVSVLVVLGGDGTSRAVRRGASKTPLLALSTGTNNVFPIHAEATVVGLAAGVLATGGVSREEGVRAADILEVDVNGVCVDLALVDVAVSMDNFIGARAVWDMDRVHAVCLARSRADTIGLSAIGGQIQDCDPWSGTGLAIRVSPDAPYRIRAAIAPGLFVTAGIVSCEVLLPGEPFEVEAPCVLALDGEREVCLRRGDRGAVRLVEKGVQVVDVERVLAKAREEGLFRL